MNVFAIINPTSGAGRTGRHMLRIRKALEHNFGNGVCCFVTQCRSDAQKRSREAADDGYDLVIAVGGDGTIQEVVNGLMECDAAKRSACVLGIVNTGTGAGLAQSLDLPSLIEKQVAILADGRTRKLDIGRVTWHRDGNDVIRYFVNECQAGLGALVTAEVEHSRKLLGGFLSYGYASLKTVWSQRAANMRVTIDGEIVHDMPLLGAMVANGSRTGGGMRLAPQAEPDDGTLDVILFHEQSRAMRLKTFPKIYFGTHLSSPKVQCFRSQTVELYSEASVPLAADGEPLGCLPCKIEVLPGALRVCAGRNGGTTQ